MRTITRTLAPALMAALALGIATPSFAHPMRGDRDSGRTEEVRNQIDDLARTVNRNDNHDRISEREARGLREDVRSLRMQFRAFNRDGLSNWEYRRLEQRIEVIRHRLHGERDRDGHRF